MRAIRTLILRLLVDSDQPQAVRGVVQAVADDEQHYFTDEQGLLALLQRLSRAVSVPPDGCESDENPIDDGLDG